MKTAILLTISSVYLLNSAPVLAAPKAHADLNIVQLLQSFETKTGRMMSSISRAALALSHMPVPYLQLNKSLPLSRDGFLQIGPSCSVRAVAKNCSGARHLGNTNTGYFTGVLDTTPGENLNVNARYDFETIRLRPDSFSAMFKNENENICSIEVSCNHAKVKDWTLSQFNDHSENAFEVHTYVQKDTSALVRLSGEQGIKISEFKGSWVNGLFGSGLPGTMGMQLLIGANLKAFREPANAPLVKGARCTLMTQEAASMDSAYEKDSKYAFLGYKSNAAAKTVELVFGNWNYSPHQIRVLCHGEEKEVLAMNSQALEKDLNGAIHFYKK